MTGPRHRRRSDPEAPLVDLADVLMDDEIIERLRTAALRADAGTTRPPADLRSVGVDGVRRSPGRHRARTTPSLPPAVAPVVGDEVFALLQEWRSEITAPPLPPLPVLPAAVRSAARRRRWSTTATRVTGARSVRPALAISAALTGLLFGSAVVSAKEATPEQPLFALTTVFWPQEAASKAAIGSIRDALRKLNEAVASGEPGPILAEADVARGLLAQVETDERLSDWQTAITQAETVGKAKQRASLATATATTTSSPPERRVPTSGSASPPADPSPTRATSGVPSTQAPEITSPAGSSAAGGGSLPAVSGAGAPTTAGSLLTSPSTAGVSAGAGQSTGGSASGTTSPAPTGTSQPSGSSTTSPAGEPAGTNGSLSPPSSGTPTPPPKSTTPTKTANAPAVTSPTGGTADAEVAVGSSAPTPSAGVPQTSSVSRTQSEAPPAPAPTPPPAATPEPSATPTKGSTTAAEPDASAAALTAVSAGR